MIALWWLKQINRSISDPLEDDKHVWEAPWLWPNPSKTLHLFQESSCPNLHTSKLCNAAATALAHAMSSLQSLTWIANLTQNNTWHMWMLKRDTQKTASVRLLPDKFLSASPACLFLKKKAKQMKQSQICCCSARDRIWVRTFCLPSETGMKCGRKLAFQCRNKYAKWTWTPLHFEDFYIINKKLFCRFTRLWISKHS